MTVIGKMEALIPSHRNNIRGERKLNRTKTIQNGGFNPFSFSLTFGNPIRAVGGKTGGISGNC